MILKAYDNIQHSQSVCVCVIHLLVKNDYKLPHFLVRLHFSEAKESNIISFVHLQHPTVSRLHNIDLELFFKSSNT